MCTKRSKKKYLLVIWGLISVFFCPLACGEMVSTFDDGAEGWLIVQIEYGFIFPVTGGTEPSWSVKDGVIDGGIYTRDRYKLTLFSAPTAFLGNQSSAFGSYLQFDIRITYTNYKSFPAVILHGDAKNLYYNMLPTPVGAWTRRSIPLVGAGWRINTWIGPAATDADMLEVLSNLQGLYINAEWNSEGPDLTYLDNEVFARIPPICGDQSHPYPTTDLNCDCRVNWNDVVVFCSRWERVDCSSDNNDCDGADFNINGFIDLEDLALMASEWLLCTDVACP